MKKNKDRAVYNAHQGRRREEPEYYAKSATCLRAWDCFPNITLNRVKLKIL